MTSLFDPIRIGDISLANRIVMAPLTRNRAGARQVPGELAATYYAQRAEAGLIVTEASQISAEGRATSTRRASIRENRSRAGRR